MNWSNELWKRNAKIVTLVIVTNLVVYIGLAYCTTLYDGYTGIDNAYLITGTLTTVPHVLGFI
jgi:hypothetical protein